MEIELSLIALIDLAAVVLCLLSGFVLIYYGWKANPANQPLAIGQLCMALAIFITFSNVSKLMYNWPYLYRTGQAFVLIFIPMPFLYLDFRIRQRKWSWTDLLHAIPLFIYLADYWHVFTLSNADKIQMMRPELEDLDLLSQYTQSKYFGKGFHEKFRTILFSGYLIAQVYAFRKWLKTDNASTKNYQSWKRWVTIFLVFQFIMVAPFYLSFLGFGIFSSYHATNSFVVVWILATSFSLFFFPTILYGEKKSTEPDKQIKKPEFTELEMNKLKDLFSTIDEKMELHKFFLIPGFTINDFSKQINIPVYQISNSLNTIRGVSFLDYINQKRIHYCKTHFTKQELAKYSIEAIAQKCGFNNRNTFTRTFKKIAGQFPSEYLKEAG